MKREAGSTATITRRVAVEAIAGVVVVVPVVVVVGELS